MALIPLLVVLSGVLATTLLFWHSRNSALSEFRMHFKERAEARADTVVQKMAEYLFFVKTAGRLAQAYESGDEKQFSQNVRQFFAHYTISEAGDGYLPYLRPNERRLKQRLAIFRQGALTATYRTGCKHPGE